MPLVQGYPASGGGGFAIPPLPTPTLFISPTGLPGNTGSFGSPWDWSTVLNNPTPPAAANTPGAVIGIRGGEYLIDRRGVLGDFTIRTQLNGSVASPIILIAYPGERPVFTLIPNHIEPTSNDLITWILGNGNYFWWWGIEWRNSTYPNGRTSTIPGTSGFNFTGAGALVRMNTGNAADHYQGVRLIHCIVHDLTASGYVDQLNGISDTECYGSVFYNNGWVGPERPHEHGCYIQNINANPTKRFEQNVGLGNFNNGWQVFGTATPAQNVLFDGDIIGFIAPWSTVNVGLAITAEEGVDQFTYRNCLEWVRRSGEPYRDRTNDFGAQLSTDGGTIVITDNVLFGTVGISGFSTVTYLRNRAVGGDVPGNGVWNLEYYRDPAPIETFDFNEWYNTGDDTTPFHRFNEGGTGLQQYTFAQLRSILGFDLNGTYSTALPTVNWTFVRPTTRYEAHRGYVVIYNWQLTGAQAVDLSSILSIGQAYSVWNLISDPNYDGPPAFSGVYAGGAVNFPLAQTALALPAGYGNNPSETQTPHNQNEFHVFLVRGA